jgi:hypothetical protein
MGSVAAAGATFVVCNQKFKMNKWISGGISCATFVGSYLASFAFK